MIAVVSEKYGPPEVQTTAEIDKPDIKSDEILVRVRATTVNRTDTGFRSAQYFITRLFSGLQRPRFKSFGTEFAGEVAAIGSEVNEFKIGDKVFGFDDTNHGSHAEYKAIKAAATVTAMPPGYSFEEAAPISEGAQYALNGIRAAGVSKGHNVMVYGASGGIGSAAVQIMNHIGAKVTAVCGTKDIALVKGLGAYKVVDYKTENFTKSEEKFDFIMDAVGKSSYGEIKHMLKPHGIYISSELGPKGQNPFLALWFAITRQRTVMFPIPKIRKSNLEYLKEIIAAGNYKPVIDKKYDLADIVEASRYVESGQKVGNVVIRMPR